MRISFRDLWRWDGEVDRGVYALAGFLGFALKHNLDRVMATVVFGLPWEILNYWISPFDLIPPPSLSSPQGRLVVALVALALPFIWVGVAMTVRRLRSAGLPLWLAVLFFAPFVNLLFFVILCVLPSRDAPAAAPRVGTRSPSWLDRFVPRHPVGSAAMGMLATNLIFVPLIWWSTASLTTYGMGLFVGLPFCMGLVSALIFGYHGARHFFSYMLVSTLSLLLTGALLLGFAMEGVVCIMMAAPIAFFLALGGAAVAFAIRPPDLRRPRTSQVLPAVLLALPALIAAERATLPEPPVFAVRTTVEIEAPPEVVWRHVLSFSELAPPTEVLFRMGIAYPIKAEIYGEGVGAERRCVFSTGSFVEPIEVWDEPRLLKFSVTSNPPPMEEWTPYEEVHPPHLEGFLASNGGQFLLERLPNGRTRLEGTTWYRHSLWPAVYWRVWSNEIIHTIHLRVLRHIKGNVEKG
jgi:hypothetical protein